MTKGLEALKYISNFTNFQGGYYKDKLDAIEKELKALDCLIKELKLTVYKSKDVFNEEHFWIMKPSNNNYFNHNEMFEVSKECYDLLRKVIENE